MLGVMQGKFLFCGKKREVQQQKTLIVPEKKAHRSLKMQMKKILYFRYLKIHKNSIYMQAFHLFQSC